MAEDKTPNNNEIEPEKDDDNKPSLPPKNFRPPMPPTGGKGFLGALLLIGVIFVIFMLFNDMMNPKREIDITQFWTYVENNQLEGTLYLKSDRIEGKVTGEIAQKGQPDNFYVIYRNATDTKFSTKLLDALKKAGSTVKVEQVLPNWLTSLLPTLLLPILLFVLLWIFLIRKMGGSGGGGMFGSFGRSRHRMMTKEQSKVTFNDVAGIDDAKEEVVEIVEFLKNPKKFSRLGGRVPRGVLLIGQPGCGKTLLAKAIAGEADVPFFSISGSDFVEMFVGVGASRVRDLFKQAKASSPCIIFLDEIDAVGRKRGQGIGGGGHDEREQTLNAILVEMDGFESNDQVIVMAATNRADVLDDALTRPGRFDRQINVPLPDLKGRYQILKIYADRVKCADDVDLDKIARGTSMFSGADLAALVNEAAIAAAMNNKDLVEHIDMEEARDKVRWGRSHRSRAVDESDRKLTAYHESGHAIVQYILKDVDPLHKVSIIPRGQAGGATFALPEKDRSYYSKKFCLAYIQVCMAGRIAEELFCGDISSGAASDISQATSIAKSMVTEWGMSEKLGFVRLAPRSDMIMFGDSMKNEYSDKTGEEIDSEIKAIMQSSYEETRKLLNENRQIIENIAEMLLKYETLTGEDVEKIVNGETIDKPTVSDLLEAEITKDAFDDNANPNLPSIQSDDTTAKE